MKAPSVRLIAGAVAAASLVASQGCSVTCIEDASGTRCTAKSLKRFDGPVQAPILLDRAPGAPVTIDVLYGNVLVQRSASGKVEVQFMPFVYSGYDEQASAEQQLTQNLRTSATSQGAVTVSVGRDGGSNGLGASAVVRLPDNFDGPLTIINRGGGPINEFDLKVEFVGAATALSVTNQSLLGNCWIQGAPSVRRTTVQCGEHISVFDVSDELDITNTDTSHGGAAPAITVRLASVSPTSRGGKVSSASGSINATFPRVGGYVLNAKSPVKGVVQEGGLPAGCAKQEASASAKTISCGTGPSYELIAGAAPDYVGPPKDSNLLLSFH
jgi:hypothetical protein